jgi:hypothetical protein
MSWSPQVIKIFVPVTLYAPSPCGSARVVSEERSDPACDSVRHIAPVHSPEISFARYCCLSWSVPWRSIDMIAPCDSSGHNANETLAAAHISSHAIEIVFGNPCPPNSGFSATPGQPPSQNCR